MAGGVAVAVTGLLCVSTAHGTCGLIVRDGHIVEWPPYARRWVAEAGRDPWTLWRQQYRCGARLVWLPD